MGEGRNERSQTASERRANDEPTASEKRAAVRLAEMVVGQVGRCRFGGGACGKGKAAELKRVFSKMEQGSTFEVGAGSSCIDHSMTGGICFLLWGEPGRLQVFGGLVFLGWGLGVGVWVWGWGLGVGVGGLGLGFGFGVWGLGFGGLGFGVWGLGVWVFRVWGLGVWGFGGLGVLGCCFPKRRRCSLTR
jgi:hypothetical protein